MDQSKQNDVVLRYLSAGNRLTSWEAIEKWHITRLASIINRLKRRGYRIESEWCTNLIDGARYKSYWLGMEGE